jgi:anti-anti-sigma factor
MLASSAPESSEPTLAPGDLESLLMPHEVQMKLSLVSIEKDGYIRLAAAGEITSRDLYDAAEKNPFQAVIGEGWPTNNIILSLEKITFMDSSAIGWLIDSQRKSKAAGGKIVLHSAPPRVRDVFDLLKMRAILNLLEDEPAARKFLLANGDSTGDSSAGNSSAAGAPRATTGGPQ